MLGLILKIYLLGFIFIALLLFILTSISTKFLDSYINEMQKNIEKAKQDFSEEDKYLLDMLDLNVKNHLDFSIFLNALHSWLFIPFVIKIVILAYKK